MELYWAGERWNKEAIIGHQICTILYKGAILGWVSKVFGKRLLKFEVSTKHNKIDEASSQQCLL